MNKKENYKTLLDKDLLSFFRKVIRLSFSFPSLVPFAVKTLFNQAKAARLRRYWKSKSLEVPPILITSITNRCNLKCAGCYNKAQERTEGGGIDAGLFKNILSEAKEIGSFIVFLSGGEPMTRPDILSLTGGFPEIIFPLFTNGLIINEKHINLWKKQKNITPVISLEGNEQATDNRRGGGVFQKVQEVSLLLKNAGLLFGYSMTATRKNFLALTDETFIKSLINNGARIFIFVEYQPIDEETGNLSLNNEERNILLDKISFLRKKLPGLFVAFPGEEEQYGGCLSSGRGFLHISADSNLEPCPFAPYSDVNLKNMSLKEGLRSAFLRKIRDNHAGLKETAGCALWEKREWVKSLLQHKEQRSEAGNIHFLHQALFQAADDKKVQRPRGQAGGNAQTLGDEEP